MFPVTIEAEKGRRVIGLTHRGPYAGISDAFGRLGAAMERHGLLPRARAMLAVYNDAPDTPDAEKRSFAGFEVDAGIECPPELEEQHLPGGDYARMAYRGPYSGLGAAYGYLYDGWPAESGRRIQMAPCFEVYLNSPADTAPEELRTDIFVPLE